MARSQLRSLRRSSKGFSTVVATIFMVLAVLFLYFNVFMFMQNQNVRFQDALSQSQQLDADRIAEIGQVTILGSSVDHNGYIDPKLKTWVDTDELVFTCTIVNNGQLPISLQRLWVMDSQSPKSNSTNSSPFPILLRSGQQIDRLTLRIVLPGSAYESGMVRFRFITSRGNEFGSTAYMP